MASVIIVGGDKRQSYLKDILSRKGYSCEHINSAENIETLNILGNFDCLILPLPISKDGMNIYSDKSDFTVSIEDIIGKLKENQIVFAGSINKKLGSYFDEKKIKYYDYFDREDFQIFNSYLTAQGALRLLLENTDETIVSKKILVTGYGRVAKATAELFKNVGADVYIAARNKAQLEEAASRGFIPIDINRLSSRMLIFDYIFNTVPSNVFASSEIEHFRGKYFELASAPFGVNKEYFSKKNDYYIPGGSLPGRYFPYSSAEKLAEITIEYLYERKGGD